MSHLQTTPTGQSGSSRPLLPSPPGPPRLAFGSSKKANAGYGIVSASGFSAWKRSVKRGSISTNTNTNTNTNTTNKGNITVSTTTGSSNAFNRALGKKKGLGMGLEGTPAKKRYKTDSRISKASMGTQSTPKGSISKAAPTGDSSSLSISMTMSPLTSGSQSDIESGSVDSIGPIDDTFAIGAETIIGEDVFGLTISIDADGTTRPLSPDKSSSTPPGKGYTTRWFDPEEEYSNYLQEREEFDRLVEFAEMDVPVDFGDEDMEDADDDNDTIQAIPLEVLEAESDEVDTTRIWDITVPIRETSVLSDDLNFDQRTTGRIDNMDVAGFENPAIDESRGLGQPEHTPTSTWGGRGRSRRSRSGPRISVGADSTRNGPDLDPVEIGRGLNISKIGLDSNNHLGSDIRDEVSHLDVEASEAVSTSRLGEQQPFGLEAGLEPISPLQNLNQVDEVDFANRVTDPRWSLAYERSPRFSISAGNVTSATGDNVEGDSLGFAAAERYIKRERPRWYRATSSPTPPPPGRELSRMTYSPTPVPSINESSSIIEEETVVPTEVDGHVWKGFWKGREPKQSLRQKRDRESGVGNDSMESEGQGRRQVKKVFIEPEYHGNAKKARDARIAHYKDLETNYKLVVEQVYF